MSASVLVSAVAAAKPEPFWLDDHRRPEPRPALVGAVDCDLLVVGGGFTGLWTALLAKKANPDRHVVLVDSDRVAWAASGRNGGFCEASLTHGPSNGLQRWPDEYDELNRLGHANLDALVSDLRDHGVDCDLETPGTLSVATAAYQVAELRAAARGTSPDDVRFLDQDEVRAEVASPTYLAGLWDRHSSVLVNPARLAWGLAAACERAGVVIHEHTRVGSLAGTGSMMTATTEYGVVTARRIALGTNAFPSLVRRVRPYVVPVYDYVLVSEPLSAARRDEVGWLGRQGIADSGNQFHYYRLTADDRILWGGYDAIYHYGRRMTSELDQRPETFLRLAEHFFATFPQLSGLQFTHRWGGAIDTCTRFAPFFGTAFAGKVSYALGYTGLGVGASRFGAAVMLELLGTRSSAVTALDFVRRKPWPFPPEPLAFLGIEATRRSMARADRNDGRRDLWLRTLDRLGLGFDS